MPAPVFYGNEPLSKTRVKEPSTLSQGGKGRKKTNILKSYCLGLIPRSGVHYTHCYNVLNLNPSISQHSGDINLTFKMAI